MLESPFLARRKIINSRDLKWKSTLNQSHRNPESSVECTLHSTESANPIRKLWLYSGEVFAVLSLIARDGGDPIAEHRMYVLLITALLKRSNTVIGNSSYNVAHNVPWAGYQPVPAACGLR